MGWEDRQYYRDQNRSGGNRLWALLGGIFPLFTAFGIRVRIHASLIILIVLVILIPIDKVPIRDRAISIAILAFIILLHEFGHCFAARSVGGAAEEIILWPLGGLALPTSLPHKPWPHFVTVAGGPLVNVVICLFAGLGVWLSTRQLVNFNPFTFPLDWNMPRDVAYLRIQISYYFGLVYWTSYILLLFNLLPVYPLDGGQLTQTILWPKIGYYRSMLLACKIGMVGAVCFAIYGLIPPHTSLMLLAIAASCFLYCRSKLAVTKEIGPEMEYAEAYDFSASLRPDKPVKKRRRVSRWKIRRLRRQAEAEAVEQQLIDTILAKVSAQGMNSLTWSERRALKRATDRQRKQEVELRRR